MFTSSSVGDGMDRPDANKQLYTTSVICKLRKRSDQSFEMVAGLVFNLLAQIRRAGRLFENVSQHLNSFVLPKSMQKRIGFLFWSRFKQKFPGCSSRLKEQIREM
jgi:hypothetical protein